VTVSADGRGGKVPGAALRPIHGRADVARFLVGVTARFAPAAARRVVADVNGKPTLLVRRNDGTPIVAVSIDVDRGQIPTIWAIGHPEKLGAV
jgi:RNA polymerase sigma-70 factor, ECF subfamily